METNTLKRMWDTRPPRIPEDQGGKAVIAGVCEGIGARYQVDPTLVRVIFVALALVFGGGLFLYLLCWINMPRFGMTRSPWNSIITPKEQLTEPEKKDRSTGWWLLIGLVIFFPSVSAAGDLNGVLVTFVLFALGWYLAHQRQPEPPAGLLVMNPEEASTSEGPTVDTSHLTVPEGYEHPGTPPAWDPLGAAPGLWHLPEPTEPAPEQPKKKKRLWLWLPLAVILVCALFITGIAGPRFESNVGSRIGEMHLSFEDAASIPDLNNLIGETHLDLSSLAPLDEPKTVNIANGVGEIEIILPNNVPVDVHCEATVGETTCPQGKQNADKDGELLTINVKQRVGSVSAYFAD